MTTFRGIDLGALVPEYVLGTLPQADRRRIEEAMATSAELRTKIDEAREALADVAAESLSPVAPRVDVRARLFGALDGPDRFAPFFAELSRLLALPVEGVRAVLARIDEATAWVKLFPGVSLQTFTPGEGAHGREGNLLRLRPGAVFPRHEHLGPELGFVLEGAGHDEDGRIYHPGTAIHHDVTTRHQFYAGERRDLVILVLHHGVKLLG
jgi:quercetin dioxygenase-like cupin family protein